MAVAKRLRYGGIFIDQLIANLLLSVPQGANERILKTDRYLKKLWQKFGGLAYFNGAREQTYGKIKITHGNELLSRYQW